MLGIAVFAAVFGFAAGAGRGLVDSFTGVAKSSVNEATDEYPDLEQVWSYGSEGEKVVRIAIRGVIASADGGALFGSAEDPVQKALREIQAATVDDEVKGMILEIDSPGGGITASDMIHHALQGFKAAQSGRKIIALFEDLAASGGYYIATAADHIVAHPTTITGSIGVLISAVNMKDLADRIGIRDVTFKSGINKDLMNPLGEVSEEQRLIMQSTIDEMYERFVSLVAEGRGLKREDVLAIADGRILTVRQAMEAGLVDEIGYWDTAVAATTRLLGEKHIKIYRYEEHFSLLSMLRGTQRMNFSMESLLSGRARLMYLWRP